ncbi:hypothetical protein CH330_07890 [candidate division WOR-3 bacterium JGI_Cruoil_03_51_56]|uniref:Thaumarchaeal output domain-containing protein n=1 Tax=candidate division WOR-3 bacterium JGI_Cruoil_03_51_56 TaxID=1973747 RepID=A0A235BQE0_UNCW3|nr:MAG: hypothetical protein CH330_07890 [candidate division WOR-3 bacterium JGI_Cruoil_03_51_56]
MVLNDPKVARLFEFLIDHQKTPALEPVFAPRRDGWVSYPSIEEQLGVESDYVVRLLEDLRRLGYLHKQFHDKVLFCPACNSQDLQLVILCPKCHSAHLLRKRFLKHNNCGYVGPEENFGRGETRICPKCRDELVLLGSDYQNMGIRYGCGDCGEVVENPEEKWLCRSCGRFFGKLDVRELVLYRYEVNPAQLAKLKVERIPKARVHEFLTREGYEIQESALATGRSGAEHQIDLLATKRSGPLEHRIVVGFASAEKEVDSEEVIKLYAKAYDVDAQDTILVVSPRLSKDAQNFARHYHIKVFDAEQLNHPNVNISV